MRLFTKVKRTPGEGKITTRDGLDLDITHTLKMAQRHVELFDQGRVNPVEGGLALALEAALLELQRRED